MRSSYQTEETKQKQQKQAPEAGHSYLDVLYDEWFNKLKTCNVSIFTFCTMMTLLQIYLNAPQETWVVNPTNVKEVLGVWKIPQMPHVKREAMNFLTNQPNNTVSTQRFCNHLVEYIKKTPGGKHEEDAFQTNAQIITNMLKDIQFSYLQNDKQSLKMTKRIAHAIEALNSKKTLFQVEKVDLNAESSQSDSENDKSDSDESPEELKQLNMEKLKSQPAMLDVTDKRNTSKHRLKIPE